MRDGAHSETNLLMTASACNQPVAVLEAVTRVSYSSDPLALQPETADNSVAEEDWKGRCAEGVRSSWLALQAIRTVVPFFATLGNTKTHKSDMPRLRKWVSKLFWGEW